jgi:DNA-binding PadR family transcriptional regulator
MSIDPTRLLVLGAVRQEQPASGYAIMRELTGWGVQDWASVNPGSIYGALRTLDKEGLVALDTAGAAKGPRAYKTSAKYALTSEGDAAFTELLHAALRDVDPYRTTPFMAALCFLVDLPRHTVITALRDRSSSLEEQLNRFDHDETHVAADPNKPEHSTEFISLAANRIKGEWAYVQALIERLTAGRYDFRK